MNMFPASLWQAAARGDWNMLGSNFFSGHNYVAINADGTIVAGRKVRDHIGKVQVYKLSDDETTWNPYDNTAWNEMGDSILGTATSTAAVSTYPWVYHWEYSVALSASGLMLAAGSPYATLPGVGSDDNWDGQARVFQFVNNAWEQRGQGKQELRAKVNRCHHY